MAGRTILTNEMSVEHGPTIDQQVQKEMRVLAVDDNNIDRKLVEMLLKTSSFTVSTVNSGMKALEILGLSKGSSSNPVKVIEVDLVISDYCMPEMTGYELLKRLKESSAYRDVPVVIMSSENVPFRIDKCMKQGAEDFLIKPVQLKDVERLKAYVRKGLALKESAARTRSSSKRKSSTSPPGQVESLGRRQRLSELTVA